MSGPFLNQTVDYHQIGTVAAVTDHTSFNDSSTFAYDALNRLTNVGGYGLRAITYDDLGNQLTNGGNTYAIDANTLRMTYRWGSPNSGGFGYNGVGSLTSDPEGRTFEYTQLEALKKATVGSQVTSYQYDGDGMRTVRRDEGTGDERYLLHGPGTQLRAEYKRVNDTLVPVREYISLGDRVVASVDQVPGTAPSSCNLTFTDDPIVANVTPVKAVHVTELRTAINCVRAWYGLAAYGWTDPTITTDVTVVSAVHVEQMRTALNEAYTQGGVTPPSYTDPSLSGVGIKALHFNQLRQAVRDLPPPQPATTAAMRYYHTDPLGSVRAITDANGAQVERRDYYAFGDSQPLEGNPIRFTGKELDVPNVGLTYFGARYYTHVDARFTTVDPYLDAGALVDPQQWNRYAYVLNDPETLVDPLGLTSDPCRGPLIPGAFYACGIGRWPLDFGFFGFSATAMPAHFAPEDEPLTPQKPVASLKTCTFEALFSAIGKGQAPNGALGLVPPPTGSVAISPAVFGLAYTTIPQRRATQAAIRSAIPTVRISAPGIAKQLTSNGYLGSGTVFTIGDIGDLHIRNSALPRFDIYRFASVREAFAFGLQKATTTVSGLPASWKCPN